MGTELKSGEVQQQINRLRLNQGLVAVTTFWIYASAHATRQAFANSKSKMQDQWDFNRSFLGILDFSFLLCYASGLFVSGYVADKYPAHQVLCAGLSAASVLIALFALSIPMGMPKDEYWWFILLWMLNGLCQSVGWPTSLKLMANWWTSEGGGHAGLVFGIWAACQMLGNIVGSEMVSVLNSMGAPVSWMLLMPAINLAIATIILFLSITDHPRRLGLSLRLLDQQDDPSNPSTELVLFRKRSSSLPIGMLPYEVSERRMSAISAVALNQPFLDIESSKMQEEDGSEIASDTRSVDSFYEPVSAPGFIVPSEDSVNAAGKDISSIVVTEKQTLGFIGALMIPGCIQYCICFFCLKGANYSLYFWLAYYLTEGENDFHENAANKMETIYNASQILGGWIIGWMSDDIFLHFRSVPVFFALAGSTVPIFLLRVPSHSQVYVALLSLLAGFTIGGANNTVSSVVASDLGSHPTLGRNAAAMATVTGLIDGTGSIGAAICQLAIAVIPSWQAVFILLTLLLLTSCLAISQIFAHDLRAWFKARQSSAE